MTVLVAIEESAFGPDVLPFQEVLEMPRLLEFIQGQRAQVSTSSNRSCSAAIRSSMAMRRPLDIGLRHRALP
jgi:hypothetical protein